MKTSISKVTSVEHTLARMLGVLMVVLLLVGAVFAAQPAESVKAATCTSLGDGNWSASSTWTGCTGEIPGSLDDVVIQHEVILDVPASINSLTINTGKALGFFSAEILQLSGNLSVGLGASFGPNEGTVIFGAGSQTITTNGQWVDFYHLLKETSGSATSDETLSIDPMSVGVGGLHISGELTLRGTAAHRLRLRKTGTPGGVQWGINPEGFNLVNYVDVQDSLNVAPSLIPAGDPIIASNSINAGNNIGWTIDGPSLATVTLTSADQTVFELEEVTLTATLNPLTATGTMDFENTNEVSIVGCVGLPVTNGVATCKTSALSVGSHNIEAHYSGDFTYVTVELNTVVQVVQNIVGVDLNSPTGTISLAGSDVTFSALITPMAGSGTVKFMADGATISGCEAIFVAPNSGGVAVCTTGSLAPKRATYAITAVFTEAITNNVSLPAGVTHTVKFLGTVDLVSSGSPSAFKAPVTFTATVLPAGATGTVTFLVDGINVTTPNCVDMALVAGAAQCTIDLRSGTHNVSVSYGGDTYTLGNGDQVTQVAAFTYFYLPVVGK